MRRERRTLRWHIHDLAVRSGWEIRRWPHPATYEAALAAVLRGRNVNCVIDVGANRGQFGLLIRRLGYRGRIVSVEPGSEAFAALRILSAADRDWLAVRMALGAEPARGMLNVASSDDLSSFRPLAPLAKGYFPEASQLVRTEDVIVSTLDSWFDEFISGLAAPRVFLKIDTQGYDLEVLKGARKVLPTVQAVQIEVSFLPLYEDVPPWLAAISSCEAHGFGLYGLFPVLRDPDGQLVEADALLVRVAAEDARRGARAGADGGS